MPNPNDEDTPQEKSDADLVANQGHGSLDSVLQRKKNELLFDNLPSSLAGTFIAATLSIILFWNYLEPVVLLGWYLLMLTIVLFRWFNYQKFKHHPDSASPDRWHRSFMYHSWSGAAVWGSSAFLLFGNEDVIFQSLLGYILTGIAVAGLSAQSASLVSASGFLLLTLTPITFWYLLNWDKNLIPPVLLSLMMVILLRVTRQMHQVIEKNLTLQIDNLVREETLRDAEQLLNCRINQTPLPYIEWSSSGTITQWNPAAERLFSIARENAIGNEITQLMAQKTEGTSTPTSHEELSLTLNPSTPTTFNWQLIDDRGNTHICDWHIAPLMNSKGEIIAYASPIMNLTERIRFEEEQQRLVDIIQNTVDFIAIFNLEGDILFINDAGRKIMGYASGEAINGKRLAGLFPAAEIEQLLNEGIPSAYLHKRWSGETQLITVEGEVLTVDQLILLHQATKQGEQYFSMVMRDISKRVEMEKELLAAKEEAEAAAKTKAEFLAVMSHEIRTPMNGVLGMAELISDTCLDADQREYVDVIRQSGKSLLRIIDDILDFSKGEAGKIILEPISFDLKKLLNEVVRLLSNNAKQKGLELKIDYPPAGPHHFIGDAGRIRQIMANLISNAIKFTEHGHVLIKADLTDIGESETSIHLEIQDTGIGITDEQKSKLFQSFTQADSSTSRKFGGTGLGLAISKQLIELMGGSIGVVSQYDIGSTFWIQLDLPLSDQADMAIDTSVPQTFQAKVLLAEDIPVNQQVTGSILRRLGLDVDIAEDGAVAVEKVAEQDYDLIFMDCLMPRMDGFTATRVIREQQQKLGKHTPIIALTANNAAAERDQCLRSGMDSYISKPFAKDELISLLNTWLNNGLNVPTHRDDRIEPRERDSNPQLSTIDVIDRSHINHLRLMMGEAFAELIPAFISSLTDLLNDLEKALQLRDDGNLARIFHSIKSAANNVGATHLATLSAVFEVQVKAKDSLDPESIRSQLQHEFIKAKEELARVSLD